MSRRTPIVAANWKMHTTVRTATELCQALRESIDGMRGGEKDFGETDETVNRRLRATLAQGLKPIFCIGETGDERQAGRTEEVLLRQVRGGLDGIEIGPGFVVAYEPVWAIGTGVPATGEMANEAIAFIRRELGSLYGGGRRA